MYLSAYLIDIINNYDSVFNFNSYVFNKDCEFYKRISFGIENSFNINRILSYNFCLSFGLGSFYSKSNRAALLFCDIIPVGMFFKISQKIYLGYQIGFDIMINPKNKIKNVFYLSYRNIFFKLNFIKIKEYLSFSFSKEVKIFDFVDRNLYHFFFNGWELKFSR